VSYLLNNLKERQRLDEMARELILHQYDLDSMFTKIAVMFGAMRLGWLP
jgi:hypothetical protein